MSELDFLTPQAAGLNLNEQSDRAIFRTRVARALSHTVVDVMRLWAGTPIRSRQEGYTAVANAFLQQRGYFTDAKVQQEYVKRTAADHINAAVKVLAAQRDALPQDDEARVPLTVALQGLVQALDALA
jgi:hypothetical protein